jgi:nitroimidazol reductase NimA-like FMN-containing flavoprotein (pyridoxamine 5'-phosphate oxidase superfamily)
MLDVFELSTEECFALLSRGVVGRLAICAPEGPHVLLVNYSFADCAVYFHTQPDGVAARANGRVVAFAVDHVDYEWQHGWSVTIRGVCEEVPEAVAARIFVHTAPPRPWAAGERSLLLRVPCTDASGRRLGGGWDPVAEMPVNRVAARPLGQGP